MQLPLFLESTTSTSSRDPQKSLGESLAQAACLADLSLILSGDDEAYEAFSQPQWPEYLDPE